MCFALRIERGERCKFGPDARPPPLVNCLRASVASYGRLVTLRLATEAICTHSSLSTLTHFINLGNSWPERWMKSQITLFVSGTLQKSIHLFILCVHESSILFRRDSLLRTTQSIKVAKAHLRSPPPPQPVPSNHKLCATKVPPSKDLPQIPKTSRICLCSPS